MASAGSGHGHPAHRGKVMSWLRKVFELNRDGLNWPRAVLTLDVLLVCGAAIGVAVMLLAGLLGKRQSAKTPQPAKQPASQQDPSRR